MRGKSSIAKLRLRSGGYKCNLCGRRVIDVATLERHHKTVHNIPSKGRKIVLKAKANEEKRKVNNKANEKAFDDLLTDEVQCEAKPSQKKSNNNNMGVRVRNEILAECTPKQFIKKDPEPENNGDMFQIENDDVKPRRGRKSKGDQRRVEFECPVCSKKFNVYYTAHRHIQKFHPVNAKGEKVPINSLNLIQPIRLEQCVKCTCKIKSIEQHTCLNTVTEDTVGIASQFVCSACNQSFVSIKTFDLHVAGLHSNGVDSMFFPTLIEFTNWRLEMERETNIKYSILGEYDSKKIYRCNYARENCLNDLSTSYFCPSSMVVQVLPKGIQVHFYPEHHDHPSKDYTLAHKYKKYSITSFLKNPDDLEIESNVNAKTKLEDKDLYPQFKQLMQSVIVDARFIDVPRLRILIEKALDMTTVLISSEDKPDNVAAKLNKSLSEQEISEALEYKNLQQKRRMSADSYKEVLSSPAKRTRNKSVFTQNGDRSSPKIINTFSLASKDPLATESFELNNDSNVEIINISNVETKTVDTDTKTNKQSRGSKATRFTQSPSFNDTYKDFIDKTIKATIAADKGSKRGPRIKERNTKSSPVGNIKMEPIKPASPKNTPATDGQTSPNLSSNDSSNVKTADIKRIHNTTITKIKMEDMSDVSMGSDNALTPISERNSISKNVNAEMDFNEAERTPTPTCLLKPKLEIEYEVREQENDCNILILKI